MKGGEMRNGKRAATYRRRAAELRDDADTLVDPESKRLVLEIANRYERLAAHLEAQDRPPNSN